MSPDTDTIRYPATAFLDLLPADAVGAPVPAIRGGIVSRRVLFERLGRAGRVTQVSAPAGSGKTFLLRSWISAAGLAESTAWVPVQREERNPQRFWLSVLGALRQTSAGSRLVRELTAAPDLDGWAVVERLLKDLAPLQDRLWLVLDDMHELGSAEARRQLELLLMRSPPELRFVLATRHDLRLGLHRLRLEGELTEIRAAHLRFTLAEARELFAAAGVELPAAALGRAEAEPITAIAIRYVRALLELARGRDQEVLATFQATERLSRLLDAPDWPLMRTRALRLHALVRMGETGRAEQDIAEISEQGRASGEIRMALVSVHTVRTHIRHLFAKLGAHGRTEAVARARALGLLAPSGRTT